jgi:anion-transporting  ArsA/GET3 family ATPase
LLLAPTRAYLRAVSIATQALLRTVSKVAGAEIVQDAIGFFQAFEGMEEGFRIRAEQVSDLLHGPETAFLLVTSARDDSTTEAVWFADHLQLSGLLVEGVIVNRVHPKVGDPGADLIGEEAPPGSDLLLLQQNLQRYLEVNAREEKSLGKLAKLIGSAPMIKIPLLDFAVNDIAGLRKVAGFLVGTSDEQAD